MNKKFNLINNILNERFYIKKSDEYENSEPKTFKSIKQKYQNKAQKNRQQYLKNLKAYQKQIKMYG